MDYRETIREACAQACEKLTNAVWVGVGVTIPYTAATPEDCAAAIRAIDLDKIEPKQYAWAILARNGALRALYANKPGDDQIQYWNDQWPGLAPHRVIDLAEWGRHAQPVAPNTGQDLPDSASAPVNAGLCRTG
jgi:hypothetical protein